MSSSWKDSSDFASLAAALSKAKNNISKNPLALGNDEKKTKTKNESITEKGIDECIVSGSLERSSSPAPLYQDFSLPNLPLSTSFIFKQHKSTVSALEFESSGARFLSGSHDTTVAYWDFNGMVKDQPAPFRFIEPMGSHTICSLKYSRDSRWVLIGASSCCAKLFDRNGSQVREYCKGDPYIRDLKLTTGHVAGLSTAIWLPHDDDRFLTASTDGTLRIWHIGYRQKSELVIPVKSSVAGTGGRSAVTAATFSDNLLLTGSADGSIKLWDSKGILSSANYPIGNISKAHIMNEKISSFAVSQSNSDNFASRCTDGTVKLWDRRNFSTPIRTFSNLPTIHSETSVIFAHDKLLTGTSEGLVILDPTDEKVRKLLPRDSAIVSLAWNERSDQFLLGSANGNIEVLYDSLNSNKKGIYLMKQSAATSRINGEVDISTSELYNSRTGESNGNLRAPSKRKLDKIRADPHKTNRPELPYTGPGQGGKIGSNVTQTIMKSVLKDTSRDVDPRAALLAYAEQAAKHPKFVTTAYQETQPDPMLDASLLDKEVAVEEEKRRKLDEVERLKAERERINNRFK